MLEVRPADEPDDAVPFDRVEVDGRQTAWAAVPRRGAARLRLVDTGGVVLAEWRHSPRRPAAPRRRG
jgi:hypothetical protein